jgi:Putative auto-transporter adhesin, head GIN domain
MGNLVQSLFTSETNVNSTQTTNNLDNKNASDFPDNKTIPDNHDNRDIRNDNNYFINGYFTQLECRGSGNVSINRNTDYWNFTSSDPIKLSAEGKSKLLIESQNNARVFSAQNFFSGVMGGNVFSTSSVVCGGSSVTVNGKTYKGNNSVIVPGSDVYIDGVKQGDNDTKPEEKSDKAFSKNWKVKDLNFSSVDLSGASQLELGEGSLSNNSLNLSVSGSGKISTANFFTNLANAMVSGSGRINFTGSKISNLSAMVSGSGSVNNFSADSCSCTVSGSGSVNGKSSNVSKIVSGSGSVNVY